MLARGVGGACRAGADFEISVGPSSGGERTSRDEGKSGVSVGAERGRGVRAGTGERGSR